MFPPGGPAVGRRGELLMKTPEYGTEPNSSLAAVVCLLVAACCWLATGRLLAQEDQAVAADNESTSEITNEFTGDFTGEDAGDDDSELPSVPIEQIIVTGQRSFFLLRAQIEDAKEALYADYNDLNIDDRFDVNCKQQAWTGTHITEQQCWPVFFEQAVADNAQDFLRGNAVPETVSRLQGQYAREFTALRENILKVARENPSVEQSLLELGKLEAAYKKKREECMQKPAFLIIFRLC